MKTMAGTVFALMATACASLAEAQSMSLSYQFEIDRVSITEALNSFSKQTGFSVSFISKTHSSEDRLVLPLKGRYTAEDALEQLLRSSGLQYAVVKPGFIAVFDSDAPSQRGTVPVMSPTRLDTRLDEESTPERQRRSVAARATAENNTAAQRDVEEVIVTAQKRTQNVQDVPISIAVVGAAEISRRGLAGAEDYLRGIPGANQVDSANGPSIVIRGIESSPQNQNYASGATTATYFGETPTTNSAGLSSGTNVDLKLVDIERVEVLRGPQGTAFGNSSMGGAVRQIPVAPKLEEFEGGVGLGYSATAGYGGNNHQARGVLNLPVIKDKLGIRAVGYRFDDSGFYRNIAGSDAAFRSSIAIPFGADAFAIDDREVGASSTVGGRIAALWQATDEMRFTLSYLTQKTETDGLGLATRPGYDQAILRVAPEHVVRGESDGVADADIDIANATVEYDFGWANLLATYSYTESGSLVSQADQLYAGDWPASSLGDSEHRENVGEVRLVSQLGGPVSFLVGAYGEKLKDDYLFDYRWFGDPATNFLCVGCAGQSFVGEQRQHWELEQMTVFGEVSWEIIDDLTLTGGVRRYDYDRTIASDSRGPIFGTTSVSSSTDATGETYRLNLSYKPIADVLVYGGWSQGFRIGKPQPELSAAACDPNGDGVIEGTDIPLSSTGRVNSDSVDSYEIGSKLAFFDNRVRVDAAVFRMEWKDIPVRAAAGARPTSCGLLYLTNAGEALSEGVELQVNVQVTDPFRIDVGGSYIDAHLTEAVPAQRFVEGARLPGSPKVNANLGLQYEFEIAGYDAFVRTDSIYVGDFYGDVLQTPNLKAGDYVKVDASARLQLDNLDIDLFVKNLTNEDDFTFRGVSASVGQFHGYRLRPRTIGLQLGYKF